VKMRASDLIFGHSEPAHCQSLGHHVLYCPRLRAGPRQTLHEVCDGGRENPRTVPSPAFVSTEGKGGASVPPLHDARSCFPVSGPARLTAAACAGREMSSGWKPAIPAGLNRLGKNAMEGWSSAGFQPAIPLISTKAGKMPALQGASPELFRQPLKPRPSDRLGEDAVWREVGGSCKFGPALRQSEITL